MFNFYGGPPLGGGRFEATYRAFPLAFIDKQGHEYGDKVILPPSALDRLASLHIDYPMLFRVEAPGAGRATHCGVLEFVAQEGHAYLPRWMMANLCLTEGAPVKFRNVSLPKGTFVKLQPATSDFLDISNPKAVLERTLRAYSCLTVGDCFVFHYNGREYEVEVREARPGEAISIIETDCQVEFEAPKDYVEPPRGGHYGGAAGGAAAGGAAGAAAPAGGGAAPAAAGGGEANGEAAAAAAEEPEEPKFVAFAGSGRRLDGKPAAPSAAPAPAAAPPAASGSRPGSSSGDGVPRAKAGTFVSTGNRLLDKLQREKLQQQQGGGGGGGGSGGGSSGAGAAAAPAAAGTAAGGGAKDGDAAAPEGPKFEAFKGKGYSLRG